MGEDKNMDQNLQAPTPAAATRATRAAADVTYSITQLAEEFDLTTRAIRFYEDKGLLSPERRGQTRIYHPRDRARLILIVRGRNVGLALSEIREILDLYDMEDGCETQYRVAADKFRKRVASLETQRGEIDLQIKALQDGIARMEGFIARDKADVAAQLKKTRKQSMS